jgi:hypothetical protein
MQGESPGMVSRAIAGSMRDSVRHLAVAIPRVESFENALQQPHGEVAVMLDKQAIGLLAQSFRGTLMRLDPIDGAVHRVSAGDVAWSCRDARWSMVIAGIDADPAKAAAQKKWGREYSGGRSFAPLGWRLRELHVRKHPR